MPYKNILKTTLSLATTTAIAATLLLGCSDEKEAREIQAQPWNETDSCWEPKQVAGTYDSSPCNSVITVAKDSNGKYWQFHNSCVPDDYTVVNSQLSDKMNAAKACTEQKQQEKIHAHPWNATGSCWEPAQEAGTYD